MSKHASKSELARTLTLTHATLYGLGVTIGAGIYVLVGAAAARSAMFSPIAFLVAAAVMSLTAASFAELVGRAPLAAGEAAYAKLAFQSNVLATIVGTMVIGIAVVSASAISVGAAGYLAVFIDLPRHVLIGLVVASMAAIAAWGIKESVIFAGLFTLIEVSGLLVIIGGGLLFEPEVFRRLPEIVPPLATPGTISALLSTTLLAVFAFIGFESLANIAEEVRSPARTLPRAILLTLLISAVLYMLVVWISLVAVPLPELTASTAPLGLVFERVTGGSPKIMSAIAIVATLNGVVVQIILASRVLYGMSRENQFPALFARVNHRTQTPIIATSVAAGLVLVFAWFLPLHDLADLTSRLTLLVFSVVNFSLGWIKWRGDRTPHDGFIASSWVPWAGCASCLALLIGEIGSKGGW
jgi:basic amino acid/polyamine antiporter, APA family